MSIAYGLYPIDIDLVIHGACAIAVISINDPDRRMLYGAVSYI